MSLLTLVGFIGILIIWYGLTAIRKKNLRHLHDISDEEFCQILTSKYATIPTSFIIQERKHIGEIMDIPYQKISPLHSFLELQKYCRLTSGVDIDYLYHEIEDCLDRHEVQRIQINNIEDYIFYKCRLSDRRAMNLSHYS